MRINFNFVYSIDANPRLYPQHRDALTTRKTLSIVALMIAGLLTLAAYVHFYFGYICSKRSQQLLLDELAAMPYDSRDAPLVYAHKY